MHESMEKPAGLIGKLVETFLGGYYSLIFIVLAIGLGIGAIVATPREEEPQIVVPLADVYVYYPGASPREVEYLVATPLEKLLWQIDGVEYVYSMSKRDMAIVTVRFFVGEDRERSLVKLYNKLQSNIDKVTPGITGWVVKPAEIDDVPIVTLTLYPKKKEMKEAEFTLRRVGEEVLIRLESLENISRTQISGGLHREVRVELDREKMAGTGLSPLEIYQILAKQNIALTAGEFSKNNRLCTVYSGPFLGKVDEVERLVIGMHEGKPVHLADVASVKDGPVEHENYVRIGFGPQFDRSPHRSDDSVSAVTLSIAKKKGTNAVWVSQSVLEKVAELKKNVIPQDIEVIVTRNYGETANQKVNELLGSLFFAMVTVVALLAITMGWKEATIVGIAVPISFALALFVNFLFGYTINRVTLFALILSLGLVVDDPITNVDNIQRHILAGKRRNPLLETLAAVTEVLPPVIMSTLTIIVSFLPMFFITGMMGPYMGPMAVNVPITVSFSTLCALTFVPWLSYLFIRSRHGAEKLSVETARFAVKETWVMRFYRGIAHPFLQYKTLAFGMLGLMVLLFFFSGFLALSGAVPLKMLPFDNKNEFQIVVDMPEGAPLEKTDAVIREYERYLRQINEVTEFVSYVGIHSPIDFNGLVRHYSLRNAQHLADIRVNLLPKDKRAQQSHAILLRLRSELEEIAKRHSADLKLVEVPPGPPVISTVVAEVYGTPEKSYEEIIEAASFVKERMHQEYRMVDVDWTVESDTIECQFQVDKVKASTHGIDTTTVVQTLRLALRGSSPGTVHLPLERNPLQISLIFPRAERSDLQRLSSIRVKGQSGHLVPLSEIGSFVQIPAGKTIYHKNLVPVVYVMGEMAGRAPAEAILNLQSHFSRHPLREGFSIEWAGEGEWLITLRVFRDLGIAFGVAMLGIYLLLVMETGSLFMPIIIMMAIPLTAIGIMPGFYLLNLVSAGSVGGFDDPVFFTATGMIGMIALGGIVVRNSIVLIEFIKNAQEEGLPLKEAILTSGGVRFRPIMLTAGTTALGAWPITLDPIFSGLAWSLIFGIVASTVFSMLVVPVVYYLVFQGKGDPRQE